MSYQSVLTALDQGGNLRSIPMPQHQGAKVDLTSNDYLGLASTPQLQRSFFESLGSDMPSLTSSASRLLATDQDEYYKLEHSLERLYGNDKKALLFNSGYHANTGLIQALASEGDTLIVADRLVHASIIDGMVLSRAPFQRFRHNDFNHLDRILGKEHNGYKRIIVVVESVYSMDGDKADIEALIDLKRRYGNVVLYVDEAHGVGVVGRDGLGLVAGSSAPQEVDVTVGTFGKALASYGAFCVCTPTLREFAVNRARSLIFSTALPPISCAWTRYIVEQLPMMQPLRNQLHKNATALHALLKPINADVAEPSHIYPYIVGDSHRVVALSKLLSEAGFNVLPIRTPTVPAGTERLRISLNASLTDIQIQEFAKALKWSLNS